ncbi:hypothetical protein BJ508DRAFT_313539 [Ascobolus immersus RN42]|uniref:Uncharacterized protein n=1 Tax=Ascobolus immersus RN42 TaxID=1160509 RepID=A0A3N4HPD1_ASCIM|nr:hypothetical protein BJ508DRAFT_313539 [Ascobolus immersus RN42]
MGKRSTSPNSQAPLLARRYERLKARQNVFACRVATFNERLKDTHQTLQGSDIVKQNKAKVKPLRAMRAPSYITIANLTIDAINAEERKLELKQGVFAIWRRERLLHEIMSELFILVNTEPHPNGSALAYEFIDRLMKALRDAFVFVAREEIYQGLIPDTIGDQLDLLQEISDCRVDFICF